MPATAAFPAEAVTAPTTTGVVRRPGWTDAGAKAAGLGALTFVTVVALQNVIRGGSAPANDAGADEVLAHYADHRGLTALLAGMFVVGGLALAIFLGGAVRRLAAGPRPAWAYTGYAGAIGVLALFSVVVGTEEALTVVAHGPQPELGAIQALWALHNSVFAVLELFIGVALLGLGRAGVAAGITPPAFERLAPIGCGLLVVGAASGPFTAAGEAMPLFGLGAAGFVLWLAFLLTTGLRLVRAEQTASPA